MNAIEMQGLTKCYKDTMVVDHLTLSIKQGTLCSFLGVNGAGKTTTIRMLSTLCRPTSGTAQILGHDILKDDQKIKACIGVSPQETAIAPHLNVIENLELMAGVHGFHSEKTKQKVQELMKQFQLEPMQKKRAGTLSGGWQRRLSIAMALISEPRILFLDEPTQGLDVIARRKLWEVIESLKARMTIVLTTHYMEEAEALSDTVAIMRKGQLLFHGTVAELKRKRATSSFEQAFIELVHEGE